MRMTPSENDGEDLVLLPVLSPTAGAEELHEHVKEGEGGGADHDDVDMGHESSNDNCGDDQCFLLKQRPKIRILSMQYMT